MSAKDVAGIGITNQRETTLIWDRDSGNCIHHAIVWQDRRTADYCAGLKARDVEQDIIDKTGLRLDPYFSASKIAWILGHVADARDLAAKGRLAFGTVDCFFAVAAYRWPRACNGRDQCIKNAVVQYSHTAVG